MTAACEGLAYSQAKWTWYHEDQLTYIESSFPDVVWLMKIQPMQLCNKCKKVNIFSLY